MPVPFAFGASTTAIPLSQLDSNFNTTITLGNTAIQLGNTVTTLNNMTLANVTISSGNVTITNVTVTTANATTVNTTTLIATTANVTTGNVTNLISGNVTLTGGSITGTTISGSTGSFTTLTTSSTVTINGGTANGVAYLDGSKVLTTGSALTFDGTLLRSSTYLGLSTNTTPDTSTGDAIFYKASAGATLSGFNLVFETGSAGSRSEQMRLTSTGLGIGTSTPAQKLDVYGNGMKVNNASYTGYIGADSVFGSSGVASSLTVRSDNALTFSTGGPYTRATLDSSGNLGLGVTPSGWNSSYKAFQFGAGSIASVTTGEAAYLHNAFINSGGNYAYVNSAAAARYSQAGGVHYWFNAPSGTAGNAITFTQAMTLDASGNLGVGTTSPTAGYRLHLAGSSGLVRLQRDDAYIQFANTANTDTAYIQQTTSVFNIISQVNGAMVFGTNSTERARITSGGYFKASDNGTYVGVADATHEFRQTVNNNTLAVSATNASYTSTVFRGIVSRAASTAFDFEYHTANDVLQWQVRGDGNAYNVNGTYGTISDAKMKTDIVDASSQWADIKAIRFRKFKMKDDPSGLLQLGVVAQELEQVSPGLVDEHADRDAEGNDLGTTTKSVKTSVLLMKAAVALQEAMARIEVLEARLDALDGPSN